MDNPDSNQGKNSSNDKLYDDAFAITGQIFRGLHEKDRYALEDQKITQFIENNLGTTAKQYYDKFKDFYLR